MTAFHFAYGLRITADRPIPGLQELPAAARADLQIWFDSKPPWIAECSGTPLSVWYVSPELEGASTPALTVSLLASGEYFGLAYADGTHFVLDRYATRLWARWPASLTLEDTTTYLLGPVIGFVLRLRGFICLHASAVAIGEKAIALLGPPGAGKSTGAAAFAECGHNVLSDDIVPIEPSGEDFLVRPGYPRVCLWPESVQALRGSADALPRLTPNWEKRYLALHESGRFQSQALPLAAIYLLRERSADLPAPRFAPVAAGEALIALVANTYMNYLLDKERRAREFDLLGRLLARVPLRQVTPQAEAALLEKFCRSVVEDFHSLQDSSFCAAEVGKG